MKKIILIISLILIVLINGCNSTLTPTTTPKPILIRTLEPKIPSHYSTYISEGFFSISYPQDWEPVTSIMEELFEESKEWVQSLDPEVTLEEAQALFFGGLPIDEGYHPNVNIVVVPRSADYWELDEIVEMESQFSREHTQKYHEFSRVKTTVDGRESVIIDSEDYDPDFGTFRYLHLYTIKDKVVWLVTCTVESEDFKNYEETCYSVVRSLRILK